MPNSISKEKVLIIANAGFDGGGSQTLGEQYSKLGFPTIFRQQAKEGTSLSLDFSTYDHPDQLYDFIKQTSPDRAVFLPLNPTKHYKEEDLQLIREVQRLVPETAHISCERTSTYSKSRIESLSSAEVSFDLHFSLTDENASLCRQIATVSIPLDLNAFDFNPISPAPLNERTNLILSAGRGEPIKGLTYYLQSQPQIHKHPLAEDYYLVHEGFGHNWSHSVKLNKLVPYGQIQHVSLLCTKEIKLKQVKPNLNPFTSFDQYEDSLQSGSLNIFSTYDRELAHTRWKEYSFAVCPTLGSENRVQASRLLKAAPYWQRALEYTNLEFVELGLPTFFSAAFSKAAPLKFSSLSATYLIYERYSDLFDLVQKVERDSIYTELIVSQQADVSALCERVNHEIERVFTLPISEIEKEEKARSQSLDSIGLTSLFK